MIYYKDGAKMMRPILSREEYLSLRGSEQQRTVLKAVREGQVDMKQRLLQMNYSCLPAENGCLKGAKRMSRSVGMDIDFDAPAGLVGEKRTEWLADQISQVPEKVIGKANELGLLMLERSATKGYHLVFRRRANLSQEANLRWASELLGVSFDERAKDITRVFFSTTDEATELLYLDDGLFDQKQRLRMSIWDFVLKKS